jgi:hypothetical protein
MSAVRLYVSLSLCMEQLGSQCTDFHVIWYLKIFFRKSVEKNKFLLKPDKNSEYFTSALRHVFDNMSLNSY